MGYLESEDKCQLCFSEGADKRTLVIDCMYAVDEVVSEMEKITKRVISLNYHQRGFVMRICKACRAELLSVLGLWAESRRKNRDLTKDHDGNLEIENCADCGTSLTNYIPVRRNGVAVSICEPCWDRGKLQTQK